MVDTRRPVPPVLGCSGLAKRVNVNIPNLLTDRSGYLGGEDEPGLVGAGPAHLEVEVGELLQETIVHLDTGRSHPHTSGLHVGNCCRLNKAFVWP